MLHSFARHSENVLRSPGWISALGICIGAIQLGPAFLQKTDPKLAILCFCESRLTILGWNPVINCYNGGSTVDKKSERVDSSWIHIIQKEAADALWELCHRGKHCQKVAVSQTSLLNVTWRDVDAFPTVVLEEAPFWVYFRQPFPLVLSSRLDIFLALRMTD